MRTKRILTALLLALMWVFAAQAYDYNGVTVTAEKGSIQKIGDELVVIFNQVGTGNLTLDGYALARVMVVGGGGSGSTGKKSTSGTELDYKGNGGSGGEAIEYDNRYLAAGAYEVAVGAGGAAVEAANNGARTAGKSGGQSSFASIVAKGGAGGVVETGSQNGTGSNTVKGWGSNLKTDISGETLTYSTGGAAATSATKEGAKGADRGCGGGGGGRTNYKSGAGGKGIVIVRIKAASVNPPATASFDQFVQYVEGVAVSPFDSIPPWAATITGTTNSTQRGHFSFTVSLKDGYVWSDTFSREDRTFKWAVVEDPAKGDTYLDVTKGVRADSSNPSNATISIIGHVPSEKVAVNVLFMGTMCYAHSLKPKTIQAAINTIAKRASVDWYLFHSKDVLKAKTGKLRDYATDVCSQIADTMIHTNLSGSVAKDGEIDDNFVRNELDRQMQSNNHQALNSFMELLYEVSQDPVRSKKYDYIVLEFDGSRVADGYTAYEHEAEVAAFLKAKYDKGQVIWLVDNCAAGDAEPFGPETKTKRNGEYYYCPCSYFNNGASTVLDTDALYAGLVALTDPDKYLSTVTKSREKLNRKTVSWKQSYRKSSSTDSNVETATKTIYVNQRCASQVPYDNANTLSKYLIKAIQEKPYDLEFVDQIVDSGLEITAVHMSTSNVERAAADLNWLDVTDPSVVSIDINQAAHKVNAVVSNMCSEVWAKLDIDVRDTGSFRTGVDPVYDEDLGRLVATKDPNDGNGFVSKYDPGDDEPTAQGDSPTLEPWKYNVYVVTGLVVNGTLKIDGIETNEAFKAEGYDCSVTYRGDPGCALDSITVDGTPLTADEINEHLSDYGFTNIKADHEVVVVYTNFVVTSEPYINYYDGAEHTIGVQLPEYYDDITNVKVLYSTTEGGEYTETPPVYSNASHNVVHYKVVGHQTGYGDEEITLATGSDTVDILPREVNVTAKSARKFYDGEELTAGYEVQHDYPDDKRAEGWGFVGTDDITTVKMTGESVIGADAAKTEKQTAQNVVDQSKTRFTSDEIAGNYIVHYTNGELEVIPVAVKPVVKVYDGAPTNVEVVVTDPPAGTTIRYSYDKDGGYAEAGELTFTGPTNAWESAEEIWVEVSAPGYGAVTNRASATILPRVVVEQAGSDTKAYDGERLVCSNATERADLEPAKAAEVYEARGYTADFPEIDPADAAGFAEGEGFVAAADGNTYLRMTDDSWRLDVGETDNVIVATGAAIASELDDGTSCGNYLFFFEDGLLKVTPAAFTASAEPVEKFYDSTPTNIIVTVAGVPSGVTPTYEYSYSETEGFVPAADFTGPTNVSETAEVFCRVSIPGTTNVVSAVATIKPRIVVSHAKDGEWTFNGQEHAQPDSFEDEDAEAERSKAKWGTDEVLPDSTGFVDGEGYAADLVMTDASRITNPGTKPNVIDTAADKTALKPNTKAGNYEFHYLNGSLTVTAAPMGIEAFDAEKFYDAEPTNITWVVTNAQGVAITPDKIFLREQGTDEWIPAADFTLYVDTTNVTVEVRAEKAGFNPVEAEATITILPRVVVQKAGDASKDFDGTPLRCDDSDEKPRRELEEAERIYGEDGADAIGFVSGEGFATVPMTADSEQTELGTHTNLIDKGAVTLAEGTKPDNYVFFFDPGLLTVIQRQEEVRRDPDVEIPEESKEAVEESDKEIEKALDEMAKADQEATGKPYVKYQLTVTPTNHLDETTRTTPEKAAEDAKKQIELAESVTGSKIDKAEFVDIVLERTYSKEEAESTAAGDYHKDNWDPLDRAGEHGDTLFEVVIPVEVPEGMELIGVTRSCDNKGTEILKPKDPNDPNAEGFVYDPETKTVTLYAKDFCVFGFMMKEKSGCLRCPWGYKVAIVVRTTVANSVSNVYAHACGCYRKPTVGKLVGYVWGATEEGIGTCGDGTCGCNAWSSGRIALWKAWNGAAYPVESMDMLQLDRIGAMKDRSTAELLWTVRPADPGAGNAVGAALHLAGFGKCAHRADGTVAIKNANGFVAGQMFSYCQDSTEQVCGDPIEGEAVPSHCWALCEDAAVPEIEDQNLTVAYGKWKMEWDSKLVSRIKGKSVDTPVKPTAKYEDNPGTAFGN